MALDVICKPCEFENFKAGMVRTMIFVGKEKQWGRHHNINLGTLINISDKASCEKLAFKISQMTTYSGAQTLSDVKRLYGVPDECYGARDGLPVFLVPEDNSIPPMYEGIYAAEIEAIQQPQIELIQQLQLVINFYR